MKINELIEKLQNLQSQHGDDIEIVFSDYEHVLYGPSGVVYEVAEEDYYPKDWNIPGGMKLAILKA